MVKIGKDRVAVMVAGALMPAGLVWGAFEMGSIRLEEILGRDAMVLEELRAHDQAWEELQAGVGYMGYLEELGLVDEEVTVSLEEIGGAFGRGEYELVDTSRLLEISVERVEREEKAERLVREVLEGFKNEVAEAKKSGVKVEAVEKELVVMEEKIELRAYGEVEGLVTTQRAVLVKAVEEKKAFDAAQAKLAAARTATVATVGAQSNGGITHERRGVETPRGTFTADILRIDLSRSWARTFVAHDGDCSADCSVKPLAAYVGEAGGVAGINGTYFCPPDYSQCSGKKNSFDLLVFDYRTKRYANSGNNQYSTNPLVNFYPGRANLYGAASGFGRDTGANGVISNFPLLISNGSIVAGDTGKGTRGAIGFNGNVAWAAVVRNASFLDTAYVMQSLGANNAMNLDGGGSSALYFNGGYRVGPGRLLPNAVVFGN